MYHAKGDFKMLEILYEDKFIIVCVKPIGASSEWTEEGYDMVTILSDYRADRGEDDYIGVIHRLDKGVGGLMVYTKRNDMAGVMSKQVADGTFKKEYLAICEGHADDSGAMEDFLFHDSRRNKTYTVKKERKGVKRALLEYETLDRKTAGEFEFSRVRVVLLTGRTHQIRAQFASRKMPLLGDGKYGSHNSNVPIALYSHKLTFNHPKTGKVMEFVSEPDMKGGAWKLFE